MCLTRALIRTCALSLFPCAAERNSGPQMGISRDPWDGLWNSPSITSATCNSGNVPPLFFFRLVRSGGHTLSEAAKGPPPLASAPWQNAQCSPYRALPDILAGPASFALLLAWANKQSDAIRDADRTNTKVRIGVSSIFAVLLCSALSRRRVCDPSHYR